MQLVDKMFHGIISDMWRLMRAFNRGHIDAVLNGLQGKKESIDQLISHIQTQYRR